MQKYKKVVSIFSIFCFLICFLFSYSFAENKIQFKTFFLKGKKVLRKKPTYSIDEQVKLEVWLSALKAGDYSYQVDWYNPKNELQDSSLQKFEVGPNEGNDLILTSILELTAASPMKRIFSLSESTGYNVKFYGEWKVKTFLNGVFLSESFFFMQ